MPSTCVVDVVIAPPYILLEHAVSVLKNGLSVAAQNMHHETKGAFTGEIRYHERAIAVRRC